MSGVPVAAEWYAVTAVSETVTLIIEPHVDPLLQANIWHLRGDHHDLLFDTGMGIVPLRPLIVSSFGREPIVVLSHRHLDHAGAAHEFADVRAHVAEPVEDPLPGSLFGPELLEQLGLPLPDGQQVADLLIDAFPYAGFDPASYRLRPARVSQQLVEGDVIDLGARQLEVSELPGHTPGSIGLLDRGSRALFSGDAIYDEGLIDELPESDVAAYLTTMDRLADLDVDIVYPGHGPALDATALRQIASDYVRTRGQLG